MLGSRGADSREGLLLSERLPFEFLPASEQAVEFGLGFLVRFVGGVELLVIAGDRGIVQLGL